MHEEKSIRDWLAREGGGGGGGDGEHSPFGGKEKEKHRGDGG